MLAMDGADPRTTQNEGQKGWAVGETITFTDLALGSGVHTIKAGIKYKDVDLTAADSIPRIPVFYYDVTAAGTAAIRGNPCLRCRSLVSTRKSPQTSNNLACSCRTTGPSTNI